MCSSAKAFSRLRTLAQNQPRRQYLPTRAALEIFVLVAGLALSLTAWRSGMLPQLVVQLSDRWWLAGLVSGILYSSVFTVGPSTVVLGALATQHPVWQVAVIGGIGAMLGDLTVFHFLKSGISHLLLRSTIHHRQHRVRRRWRRNLRWLMVVLGGIIIASPLPDEVGLSLMGISRLPTRFLIPISLACNAAGILLIGLGARALV